MGFFGKQKRYFHSYIEKDYKNNQILAYKRLLQGQCEIIYWQGYYEVYYRPKSKRYGEILAVFDKLEKAYNFFSVFNENLLGDTANGLQERLKTK